MSVELGSRTSTKQGSEFVPFLLDLLNSNLFFYFEHSLLLFTDRHFDSVPTYRRGILAVIENRGGRQLSRCYSLHESYVHFGRTGAWLNWTLMILI